VAPAGGRATLVTGPDGAPWTIFCEPPADPPATLPTAPSTTRACKRARLVRLADPPAEELRSADGFSIHARTIFEMHDDANRMIRTVTMHRPGDPASEDVSFDMAPGRALLYANDDGADDVFVYWVLAAATTHFDVFRRDQRHQLTFPIPDGIDPQHPGDQSGFDFLLTSDGGTLIVREPDSTLTAYSTTDDTSVALGDREPDYYVDNARAAVLTVGASGLRSVPLDGSPERVLAPDAIDPATLALGSDDAWWSNGNLYTVPLDGSTPPVVVQADADRLLALGPKGQILYSRDPADRYVQGAGDGWLAAWRFMDRGLFPTFNADGTRLHWLEHAATDGGYGDLRSVPVAGGTPLVLGLNVHEWAELDDGRVLAVENHVQTAIWNRLVIVDEQAQVKRWVVPSATDFFLVPGGSELIADVVTGEQTFDIVRVKVPN
jgi:hypothetical protein